MHFSKLIFIAALGLGSSFCFAQDPCEVELHRVEGLVKNERTDEPVVVMGKKGKSGYMYERLTVGNANRIFRHNFDSTQPEKFGAKAVALKTILGNIEVWFFATGEGPVGNNVHHRDVLSSMSRSSTERAQQWLNSMHNMSLIYTERGRLSGQRRTFEEFLQFQYFMDTTFNRLVDASEAIRLRGINHRSRKSSAFDIMMSRAQGYQMTAEYRNGQVVITDFKIDSSITAYQEAEGLNLDSRMQNQLLKTTVSRIGKKLWPNRQPVGMRNSQSLRGSSDLEHPPAAWLRRAGLGPQIAISESGNKIQDLRSYS